MIDKKEIIEQSSYPDISGVIPCGNFRGKQLWDTPPDGAVCWTAVDDAAEFFRRFGNNSCRYILISSSSDFSPYQQNEKPWWDIAADIIKYQGSRNPDLPVFSCSRAQFLRPGCSPRHDYAVGNWSGIHYSFPIIPQNIIRWYCVHPLVQDDRVQILPFGIPEGNRDALHKVMHELSSGKIQKIPGRIYVNFSINSNPIAREWVMDAVKSSGNPNYIIRGNLTAIENYREIAKAEFVLCPPGSGLDSYRSAESWYLRATPIFSDNDFYWRLIGSLGLPGGFYDRENIHNGLFSLYNHSNIWWPKLDRLTLSYWREKFFDRALTQGEITV